MTDTQPEDPQARLHVWAATVRCVSLALLIALLAGCAATAPPHPRPTPDFSQAPRADSVFSPAEDRIRAAHGADASGFHLMRSNLEALRWRLILIDSARHTLDLQYYVWFGDKAGQLLMARVLAAADRGVKVRVLFDDLNTMLHDMAHVELRDALLARLDRHPNIEIRLFNAWEQRDLIGRVFESLGDFKRLNRRMHNKQMIADNRAAIIGGRNIGDEYFGLNAEFNFHDLDVLAVGPAARSASDVFDRYWNSEWVRGVARVAGGPGLAAASAVTPSDADAQALAELEADPRARTILAGRQSWDDALSGLPSELHPGRAQVHADSPSRAEAVRNHTPEAFRALLLSARQEVLITNAYIIPDEALIQDLKTLSGRGVKVRMLTNSLASHDVPAVNSHYETWRQALIDSGAGLHELRPDAAVQRELVDTAPVLSRFVGLHVKAMVIDRERSFVGSMNLDPRSVVINSEMGIVIDSKPLGRTLAQAMEHDMGPANSWRVESDGRGGLQWVGNNETLSRQPARNLWQRAQNLLFKLFPPSLY